MNQSSRGATHLHQQLPLDLPQLTAAKHTSLAVSVTCACAQMAAASVIRLHRYCAYGTGRYGVCYSGPFLNYPQQHQHRLAADGSLRDVHHPAMTAWRRCHDAGCGCAHHVNDVGLAVRLDTLRSQARCRCLDDAGRRRKRRFHPSSALTLRPTYNG